MTERFLKRSRNYDEARLLCHLLPPLAPKVARSAGPSAPRRGPWLMRRMPQKVSLYGAI